MHVHVCEVCTKKHKEYIYKEETKDRKRERKKEEREKERTLCGTAEVVGEGVEGTVDLECAAGVVCKAHVVLQLSQSLVHFWGGVSGVWGVA